MNNYEEHLKELIVPIREFGQLMDSIEATKDEAIFLKMAMLLSKIYMRGISIPYPNVQEFTVEIDHLANYPKSKTLGDLLRLHQAEDKLWEKYGDAALYDDLIDIYTCLVCVVKGYDEKKPIDQILWYLDEEIKMHSGDHILSALRQLHHLTFN